MRRGSEHISPVVRFLGEDAGAGGPFALLGLAHEIGSDEQVIRASNRRLHQVDCHRLRSTPDADEVRLAIHSAASQLLDPALRRELARRWPPGSPVTVPKAWKPARAVVRLSPAFIQRARMLVASSGGWNPRARKRLAHLARVNRVSALDVVRSLSPERAATQPATDPGSNRDSGPVPRGAMIEPPRESHWLGAYALLLVMASLLATTMLVRPPRLLQGGAAGDSVTTAGQTPITPGIVADPGSAPPPQHAARENLSHYTAIAHELELLAGSSRSEPDASRARFAVVYPRFVASWTDFPPSALKRSALHIADFIAGIGQATGSVAPLAPTLACDRTSPASIMIGASVMDVVLSTPGLGEADRALLVALRSQCIGGPPQPTQDIGDALMLVAERMGRETRQDDPRWWGSWLTGVRAATGQDSEPLAGIVMTAMGARLRDTDAPDTHWDRTAVLLVSALPWREGSSERLWLLSQFADASVTTPRLASLTEAMATASGAQGIDARMVLGPLDNDKQRQALAGAYKDAWFPPSGTASGPPDASSGSGELVGELRLAISIAAPGLDELRAIESLLTLANLNAAAWSASDGRQLAALDLIHNPRTPSKGREPPAPPALKLDTTERDTQWAQRAINAQGAPDLRPLLNELLSDSGPGVNSAHALVYMATLDPDSETRDLALAQLLRFQDTPPVLIAIDHAISISRVSPRLGDLAERVVAVSLPSRTDEAWFDAAHTALTRLLARAMAQAQPSPLTGVEAVLADLYTIRSGRDPASGTEDQRASAAQAAQRLAQGMRIELLTGASGDSTQPDQLDRLTAVTAVRLARADSPMARFLAYQREIVALLALRIGDRVPGSAVRIGDIVWELDQRLDASPSVLDQIAQTERAMAQLWLIELGRGQP